MFRNFSAILGIVVFGLLPAGLFAQETPPQISINAFGDEVLADGPPRFGGAYTTSYTSTIETLDPASSSLSSFLPVARAIFDTLVDYGPDGSVEVNVLKSFSTTDDGKSWTMVLPEGRRFTDGTAFDALALKSHLEMMMAEGSRARVATDLRQIERLDLIDDLTLQVTLKTAWKNFPKLFALNSSGANYVGSPSAYAKLGTGFAMQPVGSGPYMVEEFKSGTHVILKRNPDYHGPRQPYADRITVLSLPNDQVQLQAVQSGDMDIGLTSNPKLMDEAEGADLNVLHQAGYGYYNLLFNLSKPPFNDLRLRKAMIHAIRLDALSKAVFADKAPASQGFFPVAHPYAVPTAWPDFAPDAAIALIDAYAAETGWNRKMELMHTATPDFQKQAVILQQMFKQVGIDASIIPADQPTMVKNVVSGNYEVQLRNSFIYPETDMNLYNSFHSKGSANNSHGSDPVVDRILTALRDEVDPQLRRDLAIELQHAMAAWLPIVPLNQRLPAVFLSDRIGGFPGFIGDQTSFDLDKVWVKE